MSDGGQRVYFVHSIADPEHPTVAELVGGVDLTGYFVDEVTFGFDGSDGEPARLSIVRAAHARPAKTIDGEIVEPANRAERRGLERRRRNA